MGGACRATEGCALPLMRGTHRLRVLVLSRNYPNDAMQVLGLWVRNVLRASTELCDVKVVSPVPYAPPVPGLPENYARFRRIERRRWDGRIESIHPRMLIGPGSTTFRYEALFYGRAVSPVVRALRREFDFDVIHAHFTYPDGVVAVSLGDEFDVPVVITEHNSWIPWMDDFPGVRRKSIAAVRRCARLISVSESVERTVRHFVGASDNFTVIPNGVDPDEFTLPDQTVQRDPHQILFVGAIRPVKGLDVLLRAMRILRDRGRNERLVVVGEAFYRSYQQEELRLKALVRDLGLDDCVRFVGKQLPPELGATMGRSGVLVMPSRIEALGMVAVEALACGTPVVATRCGGPEGIITNDGLGVLVPPDDPAALAGGIEHVLTHRYTPEDLRAYALQHFGLRSAAARVHNVYEHVVQAHPSDAS